MRDRRGGGSDTYASELHTRYLYCFVNSIFGEITCTALNSRCKDIISKLFLRCVTSTETFIYGCVGLNCLRSQKSISQHSKVQLLKEKKSQCMRIL